MDVMENICPVCKTRNEPGATTCVRCGAALDDLSLDAGLKTKTSDMQALTPETVAEWAQKYARTVVVPESGLAFYVDGHSMPAYINPEGDFVVGRKAGSTSEMLLDLAPFGGYSLGLSRRHVVIRRTLDGYELMDLGSVNGTWLDEERLVPHRSYPLLSGSHLRLGRMRVLVLFRSTGENRLK